MHRLATLARSASSHGLSSRLASPLRVLSVPSIPLVPSSASQSPPRRSLSSAAKKESDEYITLTFIDNNDDPPSRHVIRALIPTPSNSAPVVSSTSSSSSGSTSSSSSSSSSPPSVGPKVAPAVPQHLLDLAHANNLDLEGACGGELACSTCHCVFGKEAYDRIVASGQTLKDEELDMLDLAYGLTKT